MSSTDRWDRVRVHGPTTGDLVRLGDTDLFVEVEDDLTRPGWELLAGAGKTVRDGEGYRPTSTWADGALDHVVTGVLVIDAVAGIVVADVGIRDGRIVGIGKAGNPDVMPGVHPDLVVGHLTSPIPGHGMVLTAGGIETHAHPIIPISGGIRKYVTV